MVHPPNIFVKSMSGAATHGTLSMGPIRVPCALGRSGMVAQKREGDGATPLGRYRLLCGLWRADRLPRPVTQLPFRPIRPTDGWCDAPDHANYNRPVTLPCAVSHERLWRKDHLYDIVIVLNQNIAPRRPGGGSAIFFHIAAPAFTPTEGCVAIDQAHMNRLLPLLSRGTHIIIG